MTKVLLLITGGAIGTVFRFGISTWVQRLMLHSFPFGILSVIAETYNFSASVRVFLFTGMFGGFTTFSSFTLDTISLMKTGEYKLALFNLLASNILGLSAVFLGLLLGKNVMSLIK